jgi:hypothetical protein
MELRARSMTAPIWWIETRGAGSARLTAMTARLTIFALALSMILTSPRAD